MGLTIDELRDLTALINARRAEFDDTTLHVFERLSLGEVRMAYEVIAEWLDARRVDVRELAAEWPDLPDLDGGIDRFAQHPVAGEPEAAQDELDAQLARDGAAARQAIEDIAVRQFSARAVATLGPEHTVVTPPARLSAQLPDPDIARERLAAALANGSGGALVQAIDRINKSRTISEIESGIDDDELDDDELDDDEDGDEPGDGYKTSAAERQRARAYRLRTRRTRYNEQGQAKGRKGNVLPTRQEIIAEVQRIAMAGIMPSQSRFNECKPANWADATSHLSRLGMSWEELREAAGLRSRAGSRVEITA